MSQATLKAAFFDGGTAYDPRLINFTAFARLVTLEIRAKDPIKIRQAARIANLDGEYLSLSLSLFLSLSSHQSLKLESRATASLIPFFRAAGALFDDRRI